MLRRRRSSYGTESLCLSGRSSLARQRPVEEWNWLPHDPEGALWRRTGPRLCPHAVQTNYRPSRQQQQVVLVFEFNIQSEAFIQSLRENGLRFFYLDYLEFTRRGMIQIGVGAAEPDALRIGPARLLFRDVAAVIWNEPGKVREPGSAMNSVAGKDVARRLFHYRWRQVLLDLKALLPEHVLWLPSDPLNGSPRWQNKLSELIYAERVGLRVPESICTNDPAVAKAFIKRHRGQVLFRDFSSRRHYLFRTVFANPSAKSLRQLVNAPCVFQRYVEKEFDVRAVVVGDRVFACRINSQASPAARVDWRIYDDARVSWERMRLPREVERALLRLMKEIDMGWASVDLVKGLDGSYYFLEANRPGTTYWLLPFVGLDVPAEVCRYVSRKLRSHPRRNTRAAKSRHR